MTESGNMTETEEADVFIMVCWKFWADCYIHLQHCQELMMSVVHHGNLSLLFIVMKVTV
jgi:hypothetical protein